MLSDIQRRVGPILLMLSLVACGAPAERSAPRVQSEPARSSPLPTAASAATSMTPSPAAALPDTSWILVALHARPPLPDTNITLNIEAEHLGGYSGCNWYGARYTVPQSGQLALDEYAVTAIGCATDVLTQEEEYHQLLQQATQYVVRADGLEVLDGTGRATLVFAPVPRYAMDPAALIGTHWVLQSLNGASLLPGSSITLAFSRDAIRGSAGCRRYQGTYDAKGDRIAFPSLGMLEIDCMKPRAYLEQEGHYTDSLSGATNYVVGAERLEITNVDGVLSFVPLPSDTSAPAAPTVWMLNAFEEGGVPTPVLPGANITLLFEGDTLREQGRVSGSSGCSTYTASYRYGTELAVGSPMSTEERCAEPPGVAEQAQRYLAWLQAWSIIRLEGDELRLETPDGRVLSFRAAS